MVKLTKEQSKDSHTASSPNLNLNLETKLKSWGTHEEKLKLKRKLAIKGASLKNMANYLRSLNSTKLKDLDSKDIRRMISRQKGFIKELLEECRHPVGVSSGHSEGEQNIHEVALRLW